jgi:hypothetical protein
MHGGCYAALGGEAAVDRRLHGGLGGYKVLVVVTAGRRTSPIQPLDDARRVIQGGVENGRRKKIAIFGSSAGARWRCRWCCAPRRKAADARCDRARYADVGSDQCGRSFVTNAFVDNGRWHRTVVVTPAPRSMPTVATSDQCSPFSAT